MSPGVRVRKDGKVREGTQSRTGTGKIDVWDGERSREYDVEMAERL